jgi:hypothetical protein
MAPVNTSDAARALIARRWSKPEAVQKRVDGLAEHIRQVVNGAGELTDDHIAQLRALLPAATHE